MGWCIACKAKTSKGIKICYFPKDANRKEIWVRNIAKEDWIPTKNCILCEIHFAPEMWEKVREDGKKKLKGHAIPTIFPRADVRNFRMQSCNQLTTKNAVDAIPANLEELVEVPATKEIIISDKISVILEPICNVGVCGVEVETDELDELQPTIEPKKEDLNKWAKEIRTLREQLENTNKNLKKVNKDLEIANKIIQKSHSIKKRMKGENRKLRKRIQQLQDTTANVKKSNDIITTFPNSMTFSNSSKNVLEIFCVGH
ncbi:PREDICTED: THAP domain-containing protein 8-like [Cyphomyrmex costatus]|uniref:THAP domain-containing protein 8-like n=1 Tax=Cyphomyrmex costatus TaxID=456900 RepID=UPI0008522121|nr:PREDICTED: THAP domain-containing protein 8-like [Cyphomyrmex costatus]